ncbi:MAG: CRISPR-associated endonuclease Cas1 [Candidatus Brockarchaeota archaeon]|nr:CRISPR-associated endonuclease Cas1 [Candidatus Brockarchaeota archaeon]
MRRLVINDYGVFVGVKGDRVVVKKGGEKMVEIAAGNISQVLIASRGVSMSSAFLRLMLKHRVDFVILSGFGSPLGRLTGKKGGAIELRKNQVQAQSDERGKHLAKQFAKGKLVNQSKLLKSLAKNRRSTKPELASKLEEASRIVLEFVNLIEKVDTAPPLERVRAEVMSAEARGADAYWEAIGLVFNEYVEFPKRMKRFDMPKDPVNVFLNYGYGLLASDVWMAVEHSALEPYAGFLHKDSPRRPALVMDLMEEFRQPVVDRIVLRLVSNLKEKAQSLVEEGRLTQEGRKTIIQEFSRRMGEKVTFMNRVLPLEAHIYVQTRRLSEFLMRRAASYTPYTERW